MSTCISRFATLGKGDSTHSYSPAHEEGHVDPGEFDENHLYLIEEGYDAELLALLALDEYDEEEFSIEELGHVPEAIEFENPTNLSREDREFWYDPPIRSDTEIASANRRAWYTQRGRTCLYPDCESKVRYTKPISYCEKHQDSEVARYTDPGEFYETFRINPRVHSLQKARRAQNLTQVQLGELSGISERRIEKFESGERGPSPEDRRILAKTLGVKQSELLRHPEKVVVSVW